jgi:hypothetical protein
LLSFFYSWAGFERLDGGCCSGYQQQKRFDPGGKRPEGIPQGLNPIDVIGLIEGSSALLVKLAQVIMLV